ncbi:(2Fe-2S)-binding protein [Lentibacillus sp. CBA3610]|uniref:(2Fe-2S)-binding protein n=1 Tax=Lentibacillus sp. CBA3610 TaxID=2518176 RepID=UPI00159586E0|nr:(2Fe-2S)-binding protein [Lentibacillus sp. CBA3610]QKY70212.1 (2Fe-2S)-binding protein [Lentibacillus sp. CBA3610]
MQIINHPVLEDTVNDEITFHLDGKSFKAYKGQTVAAALMANDIKKFGHSRKLQKSRGLYCANGRCCNCFMTIDGLDHVLACMTLVEDNMRISLNNSDPDIRSDRDGN